MTAKFPNCRVVTATEKALLVEIEGEEEWVPKSVIHDDSEVFDDDENAEGMLVLEEWWAEKSGLI
jgi:hypothetical protein